MIRRQARLRREYLYRKSLEQRQYATQNRKDRVKAALDEGLPLDSDLRSDGLQLLQASDWDDAGPRLALQTVAAGDSGGAGLADSRDDEYRWAGVHDPKIVITTSRQPSARLKKFAKELKLVLPNSQRMNRGGYELNELLAACRANEVTDFIKISEHRGEPAALTICHLPHGPTARFTLLDVGMRHDIPQIGTMSEQYPHLVVHNFSTPLGRRVASVLRYLFPVPKTESRRVMSFINQDDYILYRHHVYRKLPAGVTSESNANVTSAGKCRFELTEVGPRFTLRLFELRLGTPDQGSAGPLEWVLRPYMNTARKRRFLSDEDAWLPPELADDDHEPEKGEQETPAVSHIRRQRKKATNKRHRSHP